RRSSDLQQAAAERQADRRAEPRGSGLDVRVHRPHQSDGLHAQGAEAAPAQAGGAAAGRAVPGRGEHGPVRGDGRRVRGPGHRAEAHGLPGPLRRAPLRGPARAERTDPRAAGVVPRSFPALAHRADDGPAPRADGGAGAGVEVHGWLQVPLRRRVRHGEGVLASHIGAAEKRYRDDGRGPEGERRAQGVREGLRRELRDPDVAHHGAPAALRRALRAAPREDARQRCGAWRLQTGIEGGGGRVASGQGRAAAGCARIPRRPGNVGRFGSLQGSAGGAGGGSSVATHASGAVGGAAFARRSSAGLPVHARQFGSPIYSRLMRNLGLTVLVWAALTLAWPAAASALTQQEGNEPPAYAAALAKLTAGDTLGALTDLREAIRVRPDFGPAHLRLGALLSERAGEATDHFADRIEAEKALARATQLMPNDPEALLEYGLLLKRRQMNTDAKRVLDRAWAAAERKGAGLAPKDRARLQFELGKV